MPQPIDEVRIRHRTALSSPLEVIGEHGRTEKADSSVRNARKAIHEILQDRDDRLLVVIGPCSIHDPEAALEYAGRLVAERDRLGDDLEIVMRVYFEKPRTTVGWKGLINDPHLDGSFRIEEGLRTARGLLQRINDLGLPVACEFLDTMTPHYLADLVSWGAIGARTTESQVHREMASGLPCPVGFKNGTNGDLRVAIDAIVAASHPHHFLAMTQEGRSGIATTTGNADCHIVLRGGVAPNYDAASVAAACEALAAHNLTANVIIDASHANSGKMPENQPRVIDDIVEQMAVGDTRIKGVMVESHLVAGRQNHVPGQPLVYGQSITDGCIGWDDSVEILERLAEGVRARREACGTGVEKSCLTMA